MATNTGNNPAVLKYKDPGFGTNSGTEAGDSLTFETSTPHKDYDNRMVSVKMDGSEKTGGQHVFGKFGACQLFLRMQLHNKELQ